MPKPKYTRRVDGMSAASAEPRLLRCATAFGGWPERELVSDVTKRPLAGNIRSGSDGTRTRDRRRDSERFETAYRSIHRNRM
jgi:hypothetical protein